MRTAPRLPGVFFETAAPPPADVLPRSDVAVFVGFASSGPMHLPVPIEDIVRFAEVFGPDLPLAWNPERGETEYAHLAASVRAFFRNGGRRCWVIRTAGRAAVNTFDVPGLVTVAADGSLHRAEVSARSEGSWSDDLHVAAALVSELLPLTSIDVSTNNASLEASAPTNLAPGDLIRVTYAGGQQLLFPIEQMILPTRRLSKTLTWARSVWLELSGSPLQLAVGSPLSEAPARAERLTFELWVRRGEDSLERFGPLGFTPDHPAYWAALPSDSELFGTPPPTTFASLWERASSPRWPLAGTESEWSIPVDMPFVPEFSSERRSESAPVETALDRDGLSEFSARLFLGEQPELLRFLVEPSVERLLPEADFQRWGGETERRLPGIYAALTIEEATLIAVPDAVHRGWRAAPPVPTIPPSPLVPVKPPPECPVWDFEPCEPPRTLPPAEFRAPPALPDIRPPWETIPVGEFRDDSLLAVHRSLLRLCAARGDMLAVLSMPDHFREPDAIAYVQTLKSSKAPSAMVYQSPESPPAFTVVSRALSDRESVAFSYAAAYHPWLHGREETAPTVVRRAPPDGAACGIVAKRANERGPWVAPANELFRGVVGLVPDVDPATRLALQEARVNLIRPEPRGFLTLCADTLSPDEELRPINVRRLLILLRRLALRLGAEYTFEPNDPPFRRAVQRGFEGTMEYLFDRGAFAGRTHAESFRVVVDDTVNPPARVEQGQFVVELRVAPSLPLTFLTVRLLQHAERGARVGGS